MAVDGTSIAMVGIGSVLVYAGIKGYSVMAVAQNLITGKPILTSVIIPISKTPVGTQTLGTAPRERRNGDAIDRGNLQ